MVTWLLVAVSLGVAQARAQHTDGDDRIGPVRSVAALVETQPVPSGGDAADDAAIWIHDTDPRRARILGTDKQFGLVVYDLDGSAVQTIEGGRYNNVDLRYEFKLGDGTLVDVAAVSNRTDASIAVYAIGRSSGVLRRAGQIETGLDQVYGICMYRSAKSGAFYVFVGDKGGATEQYRLEPEDVDGITGVLARRFNVGSQTEGMAALDRAGVVFIGEENAGLWKYDAEPGPIEPGEGPERVLIDAIRPVGRLVNDVEGVTIWDQEDEGWGLVLVSAQDEDRFAVYGYENSAGGSISDPEYICSFSVTGSSDGKIDAVSHTDGIDVVRGFGLERFERGMLVVQDDENPGSTQNFKLVSMDAVLKEVVAGSTARFTRP